MHVEEALEGSEIIVLALSSVILNVVEDIIPHLRPGHVLLDLAKGLAPGKRLIGEAIHQVLTDKAIAIPCCADRPTIAPEAAGGVMTTSFGCKRRRVSCRRSSNHPNNSYIHSTRCF